MNFTKYNKYKKSDINWIDDIPEGWDVKRNKNIFYEVTSYSKTGKEMLLTVSHITGVTPRSEKNVNMFFAETMEGYKLTQPGDLLINTMWAWMGALGTSNYDGICSPSYNVYRTYKTVPYDKRYFDYLLRTPNSVIEMTRYSKGIVSSRLRLYPREFFQIKSPLPPQHEQTNIADYLDKKIDIVTKKILLLSKKKLKYKQIKLILINDVVTKGLDNSVETKSSEIGCNTKIPKHWEIKRIKDEYNLTTGNSLANKEAYTESLNAIPYVATKDIDSNTLLVDYNNGIYIPKDDSTFKIAKEYSSLICLEGGSAGKKLTYIDRKVCYVNKLCAIKGFNKHTDDKYMYYFLQSNAFRHQFFAVLNGLIGGVSMSLMSNFLMILPPFAEQKKIVEYLDEKVSKIDKITSNIDDQIKILKEFRKTLINDVVTGKVKVT